MPIHIQSDLFPAVTFSFSSAFFDCISREKVLSSGICNFIDITVEQMASVHSPLNISTSLRALSLFLSFSPSLTHSFRDFVCGLSLYGLSRGFMISLAAFCLPFSLSPTASPLSLHSVSLPISLYLTCLMISKESFGPHENLHSSSTTYL